MSSFERFGVAGVINAAGKMTALGGTAQAPAVATAQAEAAQRHVDLAQLRARAGILVAERCGAEAASITTGAAAGVAVAVAACVAGADLERVRRLPDSAGWTNTVLLQAGHWVDFGAPLEQMVRLGGGQPMPFGADDRVTDDDLADALTQPVAALCYVQSHHARQTGRLALEDCLARCHERGVPVIVDAAAEEDLGRYIELGADLVMYSGGKALGGPTVGFVAGRQPLVDACEAQNRGIARAMKVGKEQITGLLAALEAYVPELPAEAARRSHITDVLANALTNVETVRVERWPDPAGRAIERLALRAVDDAFEATALVRFLEEGNPSIRTRQTHVRDGVVLFDPRELTAEQAGQVAERLRAFFADQLPVTRR